MLLLLELGAQLQEPFPRHPLHEVADEPLLGLAATQHVQLEQHNPRQRQQQPPQVTPLAEGMCQEPWQRVMQGVGPVKVKGDNAFHVCFLVSSF